MVEAHELCSRVAIMNRGEIAVLGSPTELETSIGGDLVTLNLSSLPTNLLLPREIGSILTSNDSIDNGSTIKIQVEQAKLAIPRVMEYFVKSGLNIQSILFSKPTLDDAFKVYKIISWCRSGNRDV